MNLRVVGMIVVLLSVLVACGGNATRGTGSGGTDGVMLRLDLPKDAAFQVLTIQENAGDASMMGMSQPFSTTTRTLLDYTVKEIDEEGLTHLAMAYASAVVTQTIDGTTTSFDMSELEQLEASELEMADESLQFLDMFKDLSLTMVYSPDGTLVRVPELEAMLDLMLSQAKAEGSLDEAMLPFMEGMLSQYKDNLNNSSHLPFVYPDHAVAIGETWTETRTMNIQFVQMELVIDYTLVEQHDGVAVIDIKGQGVVESGSAEDMQAFMAMMQGQAGSDEEFEMDMDFVITQDGQMRVDQATGWPSFMRLNQNVEGAINMNVDDEAFAMELRQSSIITNETIR